MARQLHGGLRELLSSTRLRPPKPTVCRAALGCNPVPHYPSLQPWQDPGHIVQIIIPESVSGAKIPKQHDTHFVWLYKKEDLSDAHTIGQKVKFSYLGLGQAICLAPTNPLISSWLLWVCERFPNSCFWWSNSEVTFLYWVQQGK